MSDLPKIEDLKPAGTRIAYLVEVPSVGVGRVEVYADHINGSQIVTFDTEQCPSRVQKQAIKTVRKVALTCLRVHDHTKEFVDGVTLEGGIGENQVFLNNISFCLGFGWALFVALHKADLEPKMLYIEVLDASGKPLAQSFEDCLYRQ